MNRPDPVRIPAIDVLRGFALMGLFLIHMVEYFELYWYGDNQRGGLIRTVVMTIFSGKAWTMFALLFGVSFYLILEKNGTRGPYTPPRFLWRMALLGGIGYLHSLVYPGDILQQLALCGVFLLLVRRLSQRVLLVLAVLLLGKVFTTIQFAIALQDESWQQPIFWEWSQRNFEVFANATLPGFLQHTATIGQIPKWVLIAETGGLWTLSGFFIAGLLLARARVFDADFNAAILLRVFAASVLFAVIIKIAGNWIQPHFPVFMPRWCFDSIRGGLSNLAILAIYVAGTLLLIRLRIARSILAVLAPPGRMSLTLYVGQSLIFVPMFYGFGLGLHATIGQRNAFVIAVIAWLLQVVFAHLWFRHFRHGPLEGAWRWLCMVPGRRRTPGPPPTLPVVSGTEAR
jgi:uncharacterized protein